jgi:EAL domain-containing protein (putative c-di-GMP-specific phosphodiesterase class I)
MDSDDETQEIVRVIVMLAHNLGLKVVAEGVETQAQLNLLREIGCERAQGYLFSKPVDHQAIVKLLETNRTLLPEFWARAAGSVSA